MSRTANGVPAWMEPNFAIDPASTTPPVFAQPEIVFKVTRDNCTPIAASRRLGNCANRALRSSISTGQVWDAGEHWELDQQFLFSFEFWIDPDLKYPGSNNQNAIKTGGFTSSLSIARWTGNQLPNNQLFDLKLDATRGVTFLGRTCVPPSGFGGWHRFNMRIRWARDNTGYLEVRCDGSLHSGPPIYAISNSPTNQAFHCFRENNCDPNSHKDPNRFKMHLGILFDPDNRNPGGGARRVPADGLTVKMRRVVVRRLYVVFGKYETF